MTEGTRSRALTALRFLSLVALSLASIVGGALEASKLAGAFRMAAGLAGFGGYLVFFALALGQLPVDWNAWLDRRLEGFRSTAERSPALGRHAA